MPTRFPGGLTTALPNTALGNLSIIDPTKQTLVWMDTAGDFADFAAAAPVGHTTTIVGTGTTTIGNLTGMIGAATLTNSGAANDQISIQSKSNVALNDSTKRLIYACRVAASTGANSDILMGLTVSDTAPIGASGSEPTGVSDGIFFLKTGGASAWNFYVRSGSATVGSALNIATNTVGTNLVLAFDYNPTTGKIAVWAGGNQVATVTPTAFPATGLVTQVSSRNVDASARILYIDYILASQER